MEQDSFNIESAGSLILSGSEISGNIRSERDICLKGTIVGNVQCKAQLIVNNKAVIDGDVCCDRLFIDGLITGNVEVSGRTVMGRNAIIKGGLVTSGLTIHPDAVIEKGLKLKK